MGKQNLRKKKALDSDEENGEEKHVPLAELLAETRALQQSRSRIKGTDTTRLAVSEGEKFLSEDAEEEEHAEEGLRDTFARHTEVVENKESERMAKYVEEGVQKLRGSLSAEEQRKADEARSAEDELYAVPKALQGLRKKAAEDDGAGWATGITEVKLPVEYKLKNIEETEAAKRQMLERRQAQKHARQAGDSAGPSNLQRSNFAWEFGNKHKKRGAGGPIATDQLAVERFKRRELKRRK